MTPRELSNTPGDGYYPGSGKSVFRRKDGNVRRLARLRENSIPDRGPRHSDPELSNGEEFYPVPHCGTGPLVTATCHSKGDPPLSGGDRDDGGEKSFRVGFARRGIYCRRAFFDTPFEVTKRLTPSSKMKRVYGEPIS